MDKQLQSKAILANEFFVDLVEKQRSMYINNILNSQDNEVEYRERERLKLRGLDEFVASLESIAKTSEIQKKRIKFFN